MCLSPTRARRGAMHAWPCTRPHTHASNAATRIELLNSIGSWHRRRTRISIRFRSETDAAGRGGGVEEFLGVISEARRMPRAFSMVWGEVVAWNRVVPFACAFAVVGIAMLAPTSTRRGEEPVSARFGQELLQPGKFWAGGPHYTPPPYPPVPRQAWEPGKPFVDWLVRRHHRSPIILTNTLASRWRASKRWSPEYLSERLVDTFLSVRSSRHPVFQYYNSELSSKTAALHADHLVGLEHKRPPAAPVLENMSMAEFCMQSQMPSLDVYTHCFAYKSCVSTVMQGVAWQIRKAPGAIYMPHCHCFTAAVHLTSLRD